MAASKPSQRPPVLVTDFDGTLTERDFYEIVSDRLLPADAPDFFGEHHAGRRTLFDVLRDIFAYVPAGEARFLELTHESGLDPEFAGGVKKLGTAGWEVVIASAGCRWYIDLLLARAGVAIEVHANPGRIDAEGRLIMERPTASPFQKVETGIDKAGVVRSFLEAGRTVAFAGDSLPDLEAALLVPPNLRFARRQLARALSERGEDFRAYERWSEIARALVDEAPGGHPRAR